MSKSSQGEKKPTYHCSGLDDITLMTKSPERPFFIRLENNITIYVDRHDYNLYMRPIEAEANKKECHSRCIIAGKRCMKDCSKCPFTRTGTPLSLELQYEKYELEYADENPKHRGKSST